MKFNKDCFVGKTDGSFGDFYSIVKEVGSGSYGKVYQVKNKTTGEKRACKQLAKTKIDNMDKFADEINILTKVVRNNF
jgi:serine/threonine protein kinase